MENFEEFNELFNYFALELEPEENDIVLREKALFCRGEFERTQTKKPCVECDSICAYTISDILDLKNGLSQSDLINELANHFHPKSRKMPTGHIRRTQEAARELADHYIYAHNMKEPVFI